ncbi:MAG: hypothetical protein PHX83_00105 [Acidobacteriia bacterium]|nr:hypothetical protein [Terriglobia bacterium]
MQYLAVLPDLSTLPAFSISHTSAIPNERGQNPFVPAQVDPSIQLSFVEDVERLFESTNIGENAFNRA